MKKIILFVLATACIVVVAGLAFLYFNLNSIVKKGVETVGPEITKTTLTLDAVKLMPFSGSGKLSGLTIGNPEGYKTPYAVKVGDVEVNVQISSLKSDTIVVESVTIINPEITFEGGLTGNNLKKIQENVDAVVAGSSGTEPAKKDAAKSETKIIVKDLVVKGAKANVSITGLGGKTMTLPLPDIHLTNIGTGGAGVTPAQLVKQVLGEMMGNITKVVGKAITDIGGVGKEAVNTATEQVDKAAKSVKKLFGK